MMLIQNATLYTMETAPFVGDVRFEEGKILEVGTGLKRKENEETLDATGFNLYPGLVEAHGHIGLDGWGMGYEGHDYNEMNDPVCPQERAIDGFNPNDEGIRRALQAGVTTLCTGPGSADVLGGTFIAVKLYGDRVDDMLLKDGVAMKCAFGENPKRCYKEKGISARMTTAAKLREALFKAQEYKRKKEEGKDPAFDMKMEALLPVVEGKMPLKAHAHQANDIFTAIRIAKEFHVRLTLEHVTEGHLVAEKLAKEGYYMAVGPLATHASKVELQNRTEATPGILQRAGAHVSIITDCPVIPLNLLPVSAGLAARAGMDPYEALKAITVHPAEHIGCEDRVGSIKVGKDADLL
ncbi:MAG: amidohydrolase family protein, partial [Spirochaetales bacterium]|nr:amidohydrolase family protein [Candidatus Physcosoma equi]